MELLANYTSSTLAGSITASQTSITLSDGSSFPSSGEYRVVIDSEILKVSSRSGNTLTVSRGEEGTTAVAHASGAQVHLLLTKGAILDKLRQQYFFHDDAPPLNRLEENGTVLSLSNFSWVNQGSATADETDGTIGITTPSQTGENVRLLVRSKGSAPISYVFAAIGAAPFAPGDIPQIMFGFRESSSGKFQCISIQGRTTSPQANLAVAVYNFNSPTSFVSTVFSVANMIGNASVVWVKIEDDGTNLKYYISDDGATWLLIVSSGRTSHMTGGPDQVFWGVNNYDNIYPMSARLLSWTTGTVKKEQLANFAATYLPSGIGASDTTITVQDGGSLPATGNFRIAIDNELILVTDRSGNNLTCVRGIEGTAAAAHAANAVVVPVLTAAGFENIVKERIPLSNKYAPIGAIFNDSGNRSSASLFSWVNQGSASLTEDGDGIYITSPIAVEEVVRFLEKTAPSTPYNYILRVRLAAGTHNPSSLGVGAFFRETSSGRIIEYAFRENNASSNIQVALNYWNSATSLSSSAGSSPVFCASDSIFLKIENDGTNLKFHVSCDGVNWLQVFSKSKTDFMTSGPNRVGLGIYQQSASSGLPNIIGHIAHWSKG